MSAASRRARTLVGLAALLLSATVLTACDNGPDLPGAGAADDTKGVSATSSSDPSSSGDAQDGPAATMTANVERNATDVPVSTELTLSADDGTLSGVDVTAQSSGDTAAASLPGTMADDGSGWKADDLLEPGTTYVIKGSLEGSDGQTVTRRQKFTTQDLSLDQQTYASVAPLSGETVGVGMPVIVTFDVPVTDHAAMEQHMSVDTSPAQVGTWHWVSDTEVHYRPKVYWQAGTTVDVHVDVNGVDAGDGIYGQENRDVSFKIGDAHVYKVDTKTDEMKVFSNGKLLRTIPVTTGQQPDYTTRSGTKVIIEKFASKDMNSETVGITGADAYNLKGVQWAMRLTYSGEFIHAAPWSVGSQGVANVSHGCTGMSTANADWLFQMTNRGDVVTYTGTDRPMTADNGYGDWNIPWNEYKQGSALS